MKSDEYCHAKTDFRHVKLAIDWSIGIDLAGEVPPLMGGVKGQLLSILLGSGGHKVEAGYPCALGNFDDVINSQLSALCEC